MESKARNIYLESDVRNPESKARNRQPTGHSLDSNSALDSFTQGEMLEILLGARFTYHIHYSPPPGFLRLVSYRRIN